MGGVRLPSLPFFVTFSSLVVNPAWEGLLKGKQGRRSGEIRHMQTATTHSGQYGRKGHGTYEALAPRTGSRAGRVRLDHRPGGDCGDRDPGDHGTTNWQHLQQHHARPLTRWLGARHHLGGRGQDVRQGRAGLLSPLLPGFLRGTAGMSRARRPLAFTRFFLGGSSQARNPYPGWRCSFSSMLASVWLANEHLCEREV